VKLPPTFSAWNLLVAFDLVEHRRVLDLEHHGHCRHIEILHRAVLDGDFLASLSTLRNFTVGQRDGLRAVGSLLVPWCHPRPCIGAAAMVLIELSVAGIMYQSRKLNAADIGMGIVALAGSQRWCCYSSSRNSRDTPALTNPATFLSAGRCASRSCRRRRT
jgi:hypothetical protein